jgi:hypothetical protein
LRLEGRAKKEEADPMGCADAIIYWFRWTFTYWNRSTWGSWILSTTHTRRRLLSLLALMVDISGPRVPFQDRYLDRDVSCCCSERLESKADNLTAICETIF